MKQLNKFINQLTFVFITRKKSGSKYHEMAFANWNAHSYIHMSGLMRIYSSTIEFVYSSVFILPSNQRTQPLEIAKHLLIISLNSRSWMNIWPHSHCQKKISEHFHSFIASKGCWRVWNVRYTLLNGRERKKKDNSVL